MQVCFLHERQQAVVWLVVFDVGGFWLGDESSNSVCPNFPWFEALPDMTLMGENIENHHCTRLVALQVFIERSSQFTQLF